MKGVVFFFQWRKEERLKDEVKYEVQVAKIQTTVVHTMVGGKVNIAVVHTKGLTIPCFYPGAENKRQCASFTSLAGGEVTSSCTGRFSDSEAGDVSSNKKKIGRSQINCVCMCLRVCVCVRA